jgi:hypothetical protein
MLSVSCSRKAVKFCCARVSVTGQLVFLLTFSGCTCTQGLQEMHFIDVGLNCPGAYLTSMEHAEGLGRLSKQQRLCVVLHGSPRQWGTPCPWVQFQDGYIDCLASHSLVLIDVPTHTHVLSLSLSLSLCV